MYQQCVTCLSPCSSLSPEDTLSRSVEQLYRAIQQTGTSREQLQQDHNHSQEQIARLQARLAQDQDHINLLEAQVAKDKDQIAQLEAQVIRGVEQDQDQDQESDWGLKEELERQRVRLQRSQSRNRHLQHKLVSISLVCNRPQGPELDPDRIIVFNSQQADCSQHHN